MAYADDLAIVCSSFIMNNQFHLNKNKILSRLRGYLIVLNWLEKLKNLKFLNQKKNI